MTRQWTESGKYTPGAITDYAERMARAHRQAAIRNPAKAAGHRMAALILSRALPEGSPAPTYEDQVKQWCAIGGDSKNRGRLSGDGRRAEINKREDVSK